MRCTSKPERLADSLTVIQIAWMYSLRRARPGILETVMLGGHGLKP